MPKRFIRRFIPEHRSIRDHKNLRVLGTLLHDPNLWHLNRRSASRAFAAGLIAAWVPSLGQMLIAALLAILFRANLPISVLLIFLSNPITIPPMVYAAYRIGAWVLGEAPEVENMDWSSMGGLMDGLVYIWQPFLLGCLIAALISAVLGYVTVRLVWRLVVLYRWRKRRLARLGH